jgi:hypothetical protein
VSATQGLDVEECKDLITFEDFEGWDVTCLIASVSLIIGQVDYSVNWNRMYRKVMRSGLLASGIFDTSECGELQQRKKEVQHEPLMILQKMQAGDVILGYAGLF